jgi:hypothetical protein
MMIIVMYAILELELIGHFIYFLNVFRNMYLHFIRFYYI